MKKKKKPSFNVPNAGSGKRGKLRVKDRWRKPKGIDNKKRIRKKSHGASPKVGYKNAEKVRGVHPSGKREVLISNPLEVEKLSGDVVIRVKHGIGVLKRLYIEKVAAKKGIRVLNPLSEERRRLAEEKAAAASSKARSPSKAVKGGANA